MLNLAAAEVLKNLQCNNGHRGCLYIIYTLADSVQTGLCKHSSRMSHSTKTGLHVDLNPFTYDLPSMEKTLYDYRWSLLMAHAYLHNNLLR